MSSPAQMPNLRGTGWVAPSFDDRPAGWAACRKELVGRCPGAFEASRCGCAARAKRCARPRHNCDRHHHENILPIVPLWDLNKIIAPHQPYEVWGGESSQKQGERICGIGRAELVLYFANNDARMLCHSTRSGETLLKTRHVPCRFQWVLWADKPPNIVEPEDLQRGLADMEMALMGRIE